MQRTPPTTPATCSSYPDLSAIDSADYDKERFVNLRKRKQPEFETVENVMSKVEHKMNEHLGAWQARLDERLTEIITNAVNAAIQAETSKISASIRDSLTGITTRVEDIEKSVIYSNERQDAFENRLKKVEDQTSSSVTTEHIKMLENKLDNMEQLSRQCNIEIVNLPERRNENLVGILGLIGVAIKHPIYSTDIISVHRVPHMDPKNSYPKNVVVKVTSKLLRDNIITAARMAKGLTSNQLSIEGTTRTIYINEHLTPKNKQLFRECREAAGKHNYKYVWVKHGTILARKADSSPIVAIRSTNDISNKIK